MEKKSTKPAKNIQATAIEYQDLARQIKDLESRLKPAKEALIAYAKENPEMMDDSFQVKFGNGTYVALRVADKLSANEEARKLLIDNLEEEYVLVSLDDKAIIEAALKNQRFMKRLTAAGAGIDKKETYAVYAN